MFYILYIPLFLTSFKYTNSCSISGSDLKYESSFVCIVVCGKDDAHKGMYCMEMAQAFLKCFFKVIVSIVLTQCHQQFTEASQPSSHNMILKFIV